MNIKGVGLLNVDVYEFRWLRPGQSKLVSGRSSHQAHGALYMARKRNPELKAVQIHCNDVAGGVIVSRDLDPAPRVHQTKPLRPEQLQSRTGNPFAMLPAESKGKTEAGSFGHGRSATARQEDPSARMATVQVPRHGGIGVRR